MFVAGVISAPAATLAGGRFIGTHAMAFHGGVGRPIGRPAIARIQDKRSAQPHHRRFVGRGAPAVVVWGVSPWHDAYSPADAPIR